jgi:uncharacterized membrane protein YcaP (DUF421 family)
MPSWGFILASMLARAVNGTAAFFPTLGGSFVLVVLHRLLAYWSRRSHAFGLLLKAVATSSSETVHSTKQPHDAIAWANTTLEHLRLNGNVAEMREVLLAVLERNGHISVVRRSTQ